jgi:secreted trypsin-like serine protease
VFCYTPDCGRHFSGYTGLVIGGVEAKRSEWPWHASIFARINSNAPFKYICGGTLAKPYSRGFVILTAAHCLSGPRGAPRAVEDVRIVLGADHSSLEENRDVENAQIHNVSLHFRDKFSLQYLTC